MFLVLLYPHVPVSATKIVKFHFVLVRRKEKESLCQITAQALTTRKKCVFRKWYVQILHLPYRNFFLLLRKNQKTQQHVH